MKLGISVWNNKISPVFDAAKTLRIFEIKGDRIEAQRDVDISSGNLVSKASQVVDTGVKTIICGAVSRQFSSFLENYGVKLISWIRGDIKQVLNSYIKKDLLIPEFFLPALRGHKKGRRFSGGRNTSR